jgi:ABC-2 type transport system permease protein
VAIADARTKPWGGFVRTLPGGPVPTIVSNILASMLYVSAASVPLIAVAAIGTEASIPFGGLLLAVLALTLGTVPFGLLMVAVGYTVHPVMIGMATSVAPITLAFLGGYFTDPDDTSGFIGTIAPYTPARGPAEVVWAAAGDFTPSPTAMVMFPVWTLIFAFLALRAYRGDEGRRFN